MAANITLSILEAAELPKGLGTLFWKILNSSNPSSKDKSQKAKKPPTGQNYVWNQTFEIIVPKEELREAKLQLILNEKNKVKATSDFAGQVEIPVLDIIDKNNGEEWFELEKRKDKKDKISGKVLLKFSYEVVDQLPSKTKKGEKAEKKKLKKEEKDKKKMAKTASKKDITDIEPADDLTEQSTSKKKKRQILLKN